MTRVYFATNRVFTGDPVVPFGAEPAPGHPPPIWVGHADVILKFPLRGDERYAIDGNMHFEGPLTIKPGDSLVNQPMLNELKASPPTGIRHVIVFLHGFASPFESCFHRAAELRDNYLPGARSGAASDPLIYVFSWPSDGFVMPAEKQYMSDRADAFNSGEAIASALRALIDALPSPGAGGNPPGLRLHLVAHSMGNWALRAAVMKLGLVFTGQLPVLFENVFLMAADDDYDVLEPGNGLRPICDLARRVHVYHSASDIVLEISQTTLRNRQRLGWRGPADLSKVPNNVALVDCSDVSDTPSLVHGWHQYYRMRQEVYEDVAAVLNGTDPDKIDHRETLRTGRRYKLIRRFFLPPDPGAIVS